MSVLLVGLAGDSGEAIIRRLISQGDEVRVIESNGTAGDRWRSLGAHVARRESDMADLVERAAQNVRTVVIGEEADVDAVVAGAEAARVERVVLFGVHPAYPALEAVRRSHIQHVVLSTGRRRVLGGGIGDEALAEAIDAADDIGGQPRLELNLSEGDAWTALGLAPR
jgi:nucleoside-diphosphate-sugar epimerase